ncbi:MAG: HPr kinase/phosphorylase [Bacteroidota bacterium]|nr:HPr kinase/phosphorylase [Bacteroidota bacterium]
MDLFKDLRTVQQEMIPVDSLLKTPLKFKILAGSKGLHQNMITNKNLCRPQLVLAGYGGLFKYKEIQLFGSTESFFLKSLEPKKRREAFKLITDFPIPCIIIANGRTFEPELLAMAEEQNIPVLSTQAGTTKAIAILTEFLDDQFAPQGVVHGSFVDVHGVGILFVGRSGIGKSEIALDLVERGHRLVADDIVMLTKKRETILMGTGTSLVQHFMEIRGLGIIDIRQMFGIRSIRFQKRLEIIVLLEEWASSADYTRTGLDQEPQELMGIELQTVRLPIYSGKNITVIAEVIAINYLLRTYGYNAAQVFSTKLTDAIHKKSDPKKAFQDRRNISWLQSDFE